MKNTLWTLGLREKIALCFVLPGVYDPWIRRWVSLVAMILTSIAMKEPDKTLSSHGSSETP